MNILLFEELERKIERLLQINRSLRQENSLLQAENSKLQLDRNEIRSRIDTILEKLQEVEVFECHPPHNGAGA